jgi:biofilm PGA synthesis lipoprotein PgaB
MRALIAALALAVAGCSPARGVPIFLWHSVGEGSGDPYDVSEEEFDHALQDLERAGATPITLAQLFDARDSGGKLPARPVILTFDDGRACQLHALPILRKHHMVAETFLVTDFLADDEAHRHIERDAHGAHPYLTWDEARALEQSGAFVIESHGVTHTRLRELSDVDQRRELQESKRILEQRLGHPVAFFAYPFGAFSSRSRDLAEEAGYRGALTVQKGLGTRYALKRVSLLAGGEGDLQRVLREAFGVKARP